MPRVSDSHKAGRQTQILDAARACFARKGYQLTTIRELEEQSGMSSGAIFNYYPSKLDIFIALAEQDTAHTAQLWARGGLRALLKDQGDSGCGYTASYLEVGRQLLTDNDFRARWERRGQPVIDAIDQWLTTGQHEGRIRTDIPIEHLLTYCVITLDGTLLQLRLGTTQQALATVVDMFEETLKGPMQKQTSEVSTLGQGS